MNKDTFWPWVVFINGLLIAVEYFLFSHYSTMIYGQEWNWGWAIFFAQLLYILFSFNIVGPTELGAKLFFGKPIREVSSGLVFVPLGIFSLTKETRLVIQEQYPDEPEKIWKGDQSLIPAGMMPPLRVTHADPKNKKTEDPIEKRMTTEVSAIVRYRIEEYIQFLITIGDVERARQQIRDTVVSILREELAKKTPAETLSSWGEINKLLKEEVDKLVDSWGVKVEDVRMEEVDLGKKVNEGLRLVPRAELDKKIRITNAGGIKKEKELEGFGAANAERAMLEAKAAGYQEITKRLGIKDGSAILAAETVQKALEKSQYSIVAGAKGVADLFTTVSAIQNVLPNQNPSNMKNARPKEKKPFESKESNEVKKKEGEEK